jgi:hypothetical protein
MAVDDLCIARRQVKLLFADIDPHVGETHGEIGIARKTESDDVKENRQGLIGNLNIDMFESDDITDIFFCI